MEQKQRTIPTTCLVAIRLARDVFSRAIVGSGIVIVIAPAATVFAFMVGITLRPASWLFWRAFGHSVELPVKYGFSVSSDLAIFSSGHTRDH